MSGVDTNSIRIIDLRLLSQPELFSLSSPTPLSQTNNIPIDRSLFNESLGSRKQTYSRLRLAPPSSLSRRHHHPTTLSPSDPVHLENTNIITTLKHLFAPGDLLHYPPILNIPNLGNDGVGVVVDGNAKRKRGRGRPRKDVDLTNGVVVNYEMTDVKIQIEEMKVVVNADADKELVNKDGVVVDLVELGKVEHPYWEEIRRRSEGLKSEEELLVFLRGLEGQWGSRRMKRRVVDATQFGNALPLGWKVLLSIKKKSGVVWVNCRRYIRFLFSTLPYKRYSLLYHILYVPINNYLL